MAVSPFLLGAFNRKGMRSINCRGCVRIATMEKLKDATRSNASSASEERKRAGPKSVGGFDFDVAMDIPYTFGVSRNRHGLVCRSLSSGGAG